MMQIIEALTTTITYY